MQYQAEPTVFECPCGHNWTERLPVNLPVPAFVARMEAASVCPQCGGETEGDVVILLGDRRTNVLAEMEKIR
ncbi:MAG: hypothetical protein ABEL51_04620 [Salinibacter sp.]